MRKKRSSELGQGNNPARVIEPAPSSQASPSPALLTALRSLSANDVYRMAPKEFVVRGYEYYLQQRLQRYLWSPDGVLRMEFCAHLELDDQDNASPENDSISASPHPWNGELEINVRIAELHCERAEYFYFLDPGISLCRRYLEG